MSSLQLPNYEGNVHGLTGHVFPDPINEAKSMADPARKTWPPPIDPAVGLVCRGCGCQRLRVVYTRHRFGYTFRMRECEHCGKRLQTKEKAE